MREDYNYLFYKKIDWSLLNEGVTLPINTHNIFDGKFGAYLNRGEYRVINLIIEEKIYKVKLVNVKFNSSKYNREDVLQIRYSVNSDIARKFREIFYLSYNELIMQREINRKTGIKKRCICKENEEHIGVYLIGVNDTYVVECITTKEDNKFKNMFVKESEEVYETFINDDNASLLENEKITKVRKLKRKIIEDLKLLYNHKCQICGSDFGQPFETNIAEAHHIIPFIKSLNNNSNNLIILCPNHHRVIHKTNAIFDKDNLNYIYPNGYKEKIIINKHL